MKQFFSIVFLASLFVSISSCQKEEKGNLVMEFNTTINNTPLELNKVYDMDGDSVEFQLIQFYVSDISIQDKDQGTQIDLWDVELIDLGKGNTTLTKELEASSYTNFSMTVGLSNEKNQTDPSSYQAAHPMSLNQSTYWLMANSYIFFKIEGFYTKNGVTEPIVYHVGFDDMSQIVENNEALTIHDGNSTTIYADIDFNDLFANIDFDTEPTTHTTENMPLAQKMMNNFVQALSLN